ncbi:hypothetical protein MTR67_002208 [Solanum verrucosum]|uniref:Tf2-1-like SH3-like domain-containing protein n=1 Tax=Solanum verrucosum TaxID=315347 RepID=A0AAF0PQ02_SOLVR|nr:hypothetical protein MTR67_002208 [Solanum verrucosum]
MRFGRQGKLRPKFIDPFEILRQVGEMAFEIVLQPVIVSVHYVFNVSTLRWYVLNESYMLQWKSVQLAETLRFKEEPVVILDRRRKVLLVAFVVMTVGVIYTFYAFFSCFSPSRSFFITFVLCSVGWYAPQGVRLSLVLDLSFASIWGGAIWILACKATHMNNGVKSPSQTPKAANVTDFEVINVSLKRKKPSNLLDKSVEKSLDITPFCSSASKTYLSLHEGGISSSATSISNESSVSQEQH